MTELNEQTQRAKMHELLDREGAKHRLVIVAGDGTKVELGNQDPASGQVDVQTTVNDLAVAGEVEPAALVAMLTSVIKQQGPELQALIAALLAADEAENDDDNATTTVEEDDE